MAIEIANLVARISYEVDRASQVIADAERVAASVQSIGLAGEITATKLRVANAELAQLANKVAASKAEIDAAQASFAAFGLSEQEVVTRTKALATEIESLSTQYIKLREEEIALQEQAEALNRARAEGAEKSAELVAIETKLASKSAELVAVEQKLEAAQTGENKRLVEANAAMTRLTEARIAGTKSVKEYNAALDRTSKETKKVTDEQQRQQRVIGAGSARGLAGAMGGISRSEVTSLISALMSGRITATAFTQVLFRMVGGLVQAQKAAGATAFSMAGLVAKLGALGVVVAALAAPFAAVFAAFKVVTSEAGQLADKANLLNPELVELASNLRDIKSIGTIDLASQLGRAQNQLRAQGFENPQRASAQLATDANTLQFLNQVPNDFEAALEAATRFATRLDVQGLIDYGIEVDRVTDIIAELSRQGYGQATITAAAYAEVQRQLTARSAEAAAQAEREAGSWQGLMLEYQRLKEASAQTHLAQPVKEFTAELRNFLPFFTGTLDGIKAKIVEIGTEILRWVQKNRAWVQGLVMAFGTVFDALMLIVDGAQIASQAMTAITNPAKFALSGGWDDIKTQLDQIQTRFARMDLRVNTSGLLQDIEAGTDAITAVGNFLSAQARKNEDIDLFSQAYNDAKLLAGISEADLAFINRFLVENRTQAGLSASEIAFLNRKYQEYVRGARDAEAATEELDGSLGGLRTSAEEVRTALQNQFDDANFAQGLLSGIQGLTSAWDEMQRGLTTNTALGALAQFDRVLQMVVMNGIESLELLKLQAEGLFRGGFTTEAQFQAQIRGIEQLEVALAPIEEQARRVRAEMEKKIGINAQGNIIDGGAAAAVGAVNDAVSTLRANAGNIPLNLVVTGVSGLGRFSFAAGGGVRVPAPTTGVRPPTTTRPRQITQSVDAATGNRPRTTSVGTASDARSEVAILESARKTAQAANAAAQAITTPGGFFEGLKPFLNPRGGGGGGGGGGGAAKDDFAVTLEQIRALMRAVNEAIAIGIRGGVRIGTEGNVVPFEPGTFLNAQGNYLTVDTIVIRGVWDFADPATRRQIVKELELALTELKAEL